MYRILKYIFSIISISFLLMACNGGQLKDVYGDSTNTVNTEDSNDLISDHEMAMVTPDTLKTDSRQFISQAENRLSLNIHLSKAAINQSSNEAIKNLGKTISDQQTELHNKLKEIADAKNVQLATNLTPAMQEALEVITAQKDKQFSISYLDRIIKDSEETIKWLENTGPGISDKQLQQFAATSIPIIKQHLEAAKAINEKL